MATLILKDVGAIERIDIPIPEDGGVIEFVGASGTGKSLALDAIDAAIHKDGGVVVRDGADKAQVSIGDFTATFGKSARFKGKMECTKLEGRNDLATLIDPGIADPERADAKRIKTFVQLLGLKPDITAFSGILPNSEGVDPDEALFDLTEEKTRKAEDLVEMAALVKRDLQKEALECERLAGLESGKADAHRQSVAGVDLKAESDEGKLNRKLEETIAARAKIQERCTAAREARKNAKAAQESLDKTTAENVGPTLTEATAKLMDATSKLSASKDRCSDLVGQIASLQSELEEAEKTNYALFDSRQTAQQVVDSLQSREQLLSGCRATIEAATKTAMPSDEEIESSESAVASARQAVEEGQKVRRAKSDIEKAMASEAASKERAARAAVLRTAAAKTEDVLAAAVAKAGTLLTVKDGRMVYPTDRSPTELYADLSDGERCKIAVDLVVKVLGRGGRCVVGQRLWADLQPSVRDEMAAYCREVGLVMFTARVNNDRELTANVL